MCPLKKHGIWQIIQLDRQTADCALCGLEVYEEYGLPFFEGEINWDSPFCRTVCKVCYDAHDGR